jgi:hypothetical protein
VAESPSGSDAPSPDQIAQSRARVEAGDEIAAWRHISLLGLLAEQGDEAAIAELRARAGLRSDWEPDPAPETILAGQRVASQPQHDGQLSRMPN